MSFDLPQLLWFSALAIPGLLFDLRRYLKRRQALRMLLGSSGSFAPRRALGSLRGRYIRSSFFFTLFYLSAVVALAGPRWGFRLVPDVRRGMDVGIALDISRSMHVRDAAPSRAERAAAILRALVESSPGMRFSLTLGKGSGILAIPLTEDSEALVSLLDQISFLGYSSAGTDLEKLLDAASAGFQAEFPTGRVIILCSDGESLSGSLPDAVRRAQAQGISIVAVGLGTADGQGVPVEPMSLDMMKRDDGSTVISSLREAPLREAAEATKGIYVSGNDDGAVSRIVEYLAARVSLDGSRGFKRESMPRRHVFLILALIALGLSKAAELDLRRKQRK